MHKKAFFCAVVLNPTPGSQDQAVCSQGFQISNVDCHVHILRPKYWTEYIKDWIIPANI